MGSTTPKPLNRRLLARRNRRTLWLAAANNFLGVSDPAFSSPARSDRRLEGWKRLAGDMHLPM